MHKKLIKILYMRSVTPQDAYNAGKDAALHGSNMDNCDFVFFSTPELTRQWERGNADGLKEKYNLNNNKDGKTATDN